MKLKKRKGFAFGRRGCRIRLNSCALIIGLLVLVVSMRSQGQNGAAPAPPGPTPQAHDAAPPMRPNYELAARFMPDRIGKLIFDTSVTPHWFESSDRFWYSYETTDGTRYWIVDPLKKSKTPLWDNAKFAATLSTLTNFPYDAQHLPVKHLRLIDKDTKMRFEVEIRKNAVVPNEPKPEKSQEDTNQTGQNQTQQTEQGQQARQGERSRKKFRKTFSKKRNKKARKRKARKTKARKATSRESRASIRRTRALSISSTTSQQALSSASTISMRRRNGRSGRQFHPTAKRWCSRAATTST